MKWKITTLFLFVVGQLSFSMDNADSTKIKYSLGLTPVAIINLVPAIQLSHELSFSKLLSIGLETGFIFAHLNTNNENTRGLRLRPELKFKIFEKKDSDLELIMFYNYRYYEATRVEEVNKANFAYTEEIRGKRKTTMTGAGLGLDFGFIYENEFIRKMSVGFGLGLGNINNNYSDEVFEPQGIIFSNFESSGNTDIPMYFINFSFYFL